MLFDPSSANEFFFLQGFYGATWWWPRIYNKQRMYIDLCILRRMVLNLLLFLFSPLFNELREASLLKSLCKFKPIHIILVSFINQWTIWSCMTLVLTSQTSLCFQTTFKPLLESTTSTVSYLKQLFIILVRFHQWSSFLCWEILRKLLN